MCWRQGSKQDHGVVRRNGAGRSVACGSARHCKSDWQLRSAVATCILSATGKAHNGNTGLRGRAGGVTEMRSSITYGTVCPECKQGFRLGEVGLPPGADLKALRNELSEQGWQDGFKVCPDRECKACVYVNLERLIFLEPAGGPQT